MTENSELFIGSELLSDLARSVTARKLPFRFKAKGGSMSPFLRDGDVLTMAPLEPPLRFGAIIAFCHPGTAQLIVHRVISCGRAGTLRTRGDSMHMADARIPVRCIVGEVVKAERAGRDVRLGLGPERVLIAALSRAGLLRQLLWPARILSRALTH